MKPDIEALRAFFARAPFMVDLGIEPTGGDEGRIDTALPLQPRHFQHTGQVHAGVMATLADHSMGAAAQTLAAEGFVVITGAPDQLHRGRCLVPARRRAGARAACGGDDGAGGRRTVRLKIPAQPFNGRLTQDTTT